MSEQTPGTPQLDARDLTIEGLGGARFVAEFYSRRKAAEAVSVLMNDGHGHHFAVVGEGHHLVISHMAVECLRRAHKLPLTESWVYEQGRE